MSATPKSRAKDVVFSRRSDSRSPSSASGKQPSITPSSSNEGNSRHGSGFLIDDSLRNRQNAFPRMSGESGRLGSPLSQELSVDYASPPMDPAQLVQMALDLSESRKRHTSRTMQPQRIDITPKYNSLRSRHSPSPRHEDYPRESHDSQPSSDPSSATLARVEHARRYFELAAEHRGVLAKVNRPYNPLQTLRNRGQRGTTNSWLDVDGIKQWAHGIKVADDIHKYPLPRDGHRRTDTADSILFKPAKANSWTVEPTESLEDLYWVATSSKRGRTSEHAKEILDTDAYDTQGEGRTRRRNLLARRRKRPRADSVSTVSSEEGSRPRDGADVNIGPLERHMREVISKHENGSPEEKSPEHWDPPARPQPMRSTSASGRPRAETVTSMTSDEPSSPIPNFPPRNKSKLHRLPMFKSRDTTVEPVDNFDGPSSRHSLDLPRPGFGRHRTTESWGGSAKRDDPFESSENTMQRLFKGGRLGEYVRNEGARLRKKPPDIKPDAEESEESEENVQAIDFGKKQQYYLPDLPSFTSRKRQEQQNLLTPSGSRSDLPALSTIESQRHWSISDRVPTVSSSSVTAKEVARVRALLLASGIKASELINRQKREEKEDGQRLSGEIDACLSSTEQCLRTQQDTAQALTDQLDKLLERASTLLSHDATDQADQFTAELMSKAPQDIRRLDDAINQMLRRQRRQFRVIRRTGFKMLEIFLVLMFRFLWLIFMLFTSIRSIVVLFLKVIKWIVVF